MNAGENLKNRTNMKLDKDQFTDLLGLQVELLKYEPYLRYGQAFFNALLRLHPELAEEIRATSIDPFHNNSNIPKAMAYVQQENQPTVKEEYELYLKLKEKFNGKETQY